MEAVFYTLLILFALAEVFIAVRYARTGQSKSIKAVLVPAGLYLKMYRKSKVYDRYLHGIGSFSFALLLYLTTSKVTAPGGSVAFRAVFVAAIGIVSGAVFEIVEFVHDLRNKTNMQRGLKDTNLDLIFDVIGSAAAAILAAFVYL